MRKLLAFALAVVLSAFTLPYVLCTVVNLTKDETSVPEAEGDAVTCGSFDDTFKITVYNTAEDKLLEVNFEEYLVGVLAGEMPASYETEALKAQAVAARSYILSRIADCLEGKTSEEHKGAMVCTNYEHCNAWRDISEQKKSWDVRYADDYEAKLRRAVKLTEGEYMVYDNRVVKAYFYAISGGRTENVEEVWGTALPYLKSVPSREDIGSDGYESRSAYPKDLFVQKLKSAKSEVNITELKSCVGEVKNTQAGSVSEIVIGGASFTGKEIRELFNLRSTNFSIETEGDKVTFIVRGYGHGVGMSQNGANVMAQQGKSYREILSHYYTGVSIVNLYKKA